MEIKPTEKSFAILPVLVINRIINSLTPEAQETFDCVWDPYYTIEFGWGKWIYSYNF